MASSLDLHGVSLTEVAKLTGLSITSVWRHVRGIRQIKADNALKYSRVLGIPLSELRPDLWLPEDGLANVQGQP